MIPLKLVIEGFLKYRDRVELDFTGQSLWMLFGPNGAGKSSVFDAMTYALYGMHRGGAQKPDRLINQQADKFIVEFDFLIEHSPYRIRRTVAHNGRNTCLISAISEGNQVDPIPGTDSVRQFDEWVSQHLGLDYQAFTACVLLRQGESDRLINEDPSKRHEIIGQVINIQQYEALRQRTKQRQDDADREVKRLREEIAAIEVVTAADVAAADRAREAATRYWQQQEAEREALLRRAGDVRRWNTVMAEQLNLTTQIKRAAQSLAQAQQIERDYARHQVLDRNIPPLRHIAQGRGQLAHTEDERAKAAQAVRQATAQYEAETAAHAVVRQRLEQRRAELTEKTREERACQQRKESLAPQVAASARLADLREKLGEIDRQLAAYPVDLAEQAAACKDGIQQAHTAQALSGPLRQFAQARAQWQQAQATLGAADVALAAIQAQTPDGLAVEAYAQQRRDAVVRNEEQCKGYRGRLARLERLDGKAECEMCGQPLTAAHVQTERVRLQSALHAAEQVQQVDHVHHATAQELLRNYQREMELQRDTTTSLHQHEQTAHNALAALPAPIRFQIAAGADLAQTLVGHAYPTARDLDAVQQHAGQLAEWQHRLATLEEQEKTAHFLQGQRLLLATELTHLERDFPPEMIATVQADYQAVNAQIVILQQALAEIEVAIAADNLHDKQLAERVATMQGEIATAHTAEARSQGAYASQRDELAKASAACPTELCSPEEVDAPALARWDAEFAALAAAPLAKQTLDDERAVQQQRQEKLHVLQQEIIAFPEETRMDLAAYEQQCALSEQQRAAAHQAMRDAERTYQTRSDRQQIREAREAQLHTESRAAALWKRLAQMLDREHMQRYLLRQAEQSIVAFANLTLEPISGYTLRLDAREDGAQTFDLVAFDSNAGSHPISVKFLSGSQKFRVAFSLAMGIGRYVTAGRQTPEAVFIDEGFGSLDQDGRQHIISAIAELAQHIQRIILVSHQDEFAQAFPHAYHIYPDGETSRAQYKVIEDLLMEADPAAPALAYAELLLPDE